MKRHGLEDALAAVRAASAGSLKLSRAVAYALGDGDPISRRSYELYGPDMHPPGNLKKGSGWFPAPYTESLDAADKRLPNGWNLLSGVDEDRPFARISHREHGTFTEMGATEALARIAAVLRAQILSGPQDLDLEDMLS